jgi:HD-GYP domain-containing protein (c-di-GMP phosphodiesterase class II)
MRDILFSCQLHDLGKIGINDEILMKKGPLNPQEWEIMKTHPTLGEEMLKPIKSLRNVALIIGQEHERYDGKGYPRALKGAEVLLTAQIVSVADAFDVITSKRSYKEAQSVEFALAEISRCSGTQFHPRVVQALLDAVNKNYSVIMEFLANRDVEGYVEGKIQEFLERSRIYL